MNALKPRPAFQVLIMSEESRLGREAIETAYALKQIHHGRRARVLLPRGPRAHARESDRQAADVASPPSPTRLEREKARQRTLDAMVRKARAGHNCGGRTFGYDNVDVPGPNGERAYVTYQVNDRRSRRRAPDLRAGGDGRRPQGHHQAAEHGRATAPRPQQGRTRSWAPSSVREILHREMYRGRRVWNKTRKRDTWGQQRQHDRPASDWMTVENEQLRVVSDAQWQAAHDRMDARRTAHDRWKRGDVTGAANGQGVRTRYFLTGFGRCACCGGSIQAMSRFARDGGRHIPLLLRDVLEPRRVHLCERSAAGYAGGRSGRA